MSGAQIDAQAGGDVLQGRLAFFPIPFFAMVMGMSGLTIGWEKAQHLLGLDLGITPWLVGFSSLLFLTLALLYAAKLLRHPQAVLAELRHPVKLNFFPTISISLLLLAIAYLPLQQVVSQTLWFAGAALHLTFTLYIVSAWMHHEHFKVQHMNPAWFIPAVGNVLVPIAGVPLGFESISWFFFSVGVLFWLVLLTIIFNRVLFHNPIEDRLTPTLFILIAPPAVGFIAYTRLVDSLDTFALILYFAAMFLTLLLFSQAGRFLRLRFFLSWWAYSFPLAAFSIASMVMAEQTGALFYRYFGVAMLTMLTGIIAILLWSTLRAVLRRGICVPGH
ncbi:C4-dicarboxylate ABC transporter [Marichromatium purpuratum 984]|uniref:C4-dicarboxylate ABC transporter n=1 Tax=Marichromatium purpuratum 984 TaxID=765910 RepID=W0E314_MARPU|nr:SLAC1 anion channel family protein [Marichromatium purpuratum]AHF03614.1 C4-dicarboxylate ABC transporter [Marichromatium purpuratum 984]